MLSLLILMMLGIVNFIHLFHSSARYTPNETNDGSTNGRSATNGRHDADGCGNGTDAATHAARCYPGTVWADTRSTATAATAIDDKHQCTAGSVWSAVKISEMRSYVRRNTFIAIILCNYLNRRNHNNPHTMTLRKTISLYLWYLLLTEMSHISIAWGVSSQNSIKQACKK